MLIYLYIFIFFNFTYTKLLPSIKNNNSMPFGHIYQINNIGKNINNNLRNLTETNNNKKNLILGLVFDYPWSTLRNYFISLIKAGYQNCDIVMFVKGMSEETINKIKSCGVIIKNIPEDYDFNSEIPINSFRWKVYSDFLKNNTDKYDKVFTTDIRDSIFQKDIFQFYNKKSFLGVFLEDGDLTENLNSQWMKMLCSEEIYKTISNKRIICAGSLIGSIDKFIEYCDAFYEMALEKKQNGIDQAILNYIIYYKKLFEDSLIIEDNHGPLMTLGISKQEEIKMDKDDNIVNFNGEIAAVIHQYDKTEERTNKISNKYNDNFDIDTFMKEREKEIITFKKRNFNKKIIIIIFITLIIFLFTFIIIKRYLNYKQNNYKKILMKKYKKRNRKSRYVDIRESSKLNN